MVAQLKRFPLPARLLLVSMVISLVLLAGCYGVIMLLLGGCYDVAKWLLGGCYGVAVWLLDGC